MMLLNRAGHLWNSLFPKRVLPHVTRCHTNPIRTIQTKDKLVSEKDPEELLDRLYNEVRAQRFSEIVVIQTKNNADPRYLILANAFSKRHLVSGTMMINQSYKNDPSYGFGDISISPEWNVMDFHGVVVHLFSKECREHFDIEQLWAVGEKYDSQCQQTNPK